MAEVCKEHSGLLQANEDLGRTVDRQQKAIEELQHRLPNWATFVISTLTFFLGSSLTVVGMLIKGVPIHKAAAIFTYLKGLV